MTNGSTGSGLGQFFEEHKRGILLTLLCALIILVALLFTQCDSCSGIYNRLPIIGGGETSSTNGTPGPEVADGCTHCRNNEEFRRQVVHLVTTDQEIATWLKELICTTDCTPPPPEKKEKTNPSSGRCCSDLGPGWSCIDTRRYRCVETRRDLCPGPSYIRCGRECSPRNGGGNPPPDEARWEYHEFTCDTDCDTLYSDVMLNPDATIVDSNNSPVTTTGSGPERHFAPTRVVRVRVPAGTQVHNANLRATNGQWAVDTSGARVSGTTEVSDPNFGVRHNGRPLGSGDSRKPRGTWTFDVASPTPTPATPSTSGNTGTFDPP